MFYMSIQMMVCRADIFRVLQGFFYVETLFYRNTLFVGFKLSSRVNVILHTGQTNLLSPWFLFGSSECHYITLLRLTSDKFYNQTF